MGQGREKGRGNDVPCENSSGKDFCGSRVQAEECDENGGLIKGDGVDAAHLLKALRRRGNEGSVREA